VEDEPSFLERADQVTAEVMQPNVPVTLLRGREQHAVEREQSARLEHAVQLREVEEDIEEIQEDVEELGEDVEDIQEDIEEISEDIDEIQEDVEELSEEENADAEARKEVAVETEKREKREKKERKDRDEKEILERLSLDVHKLISELEALRAKSDTGE
jgi:methyl-accepting chemotaxis protein